MKRAIGIICFIALLIVTVTALADQPAGIVVSNYQEMLDAVNDQKADLILISPRYRYKKEKSKMNHADCLNAEGRTITIRPEKEGEKATIEGYINIIGEGTVNIENIDIIAPIGNSALSVDDGAHVTACKVTGGKRKSNNGCTAAYVHDASLTIDSAIGSDGMNGIGGDGIVIYGHSTVEIREAVGGSADQGIGGAGVVVAGESEVTITGGATGGNGLYNVGKGVLAGWGSKYSGEGAVTDGTLLEGKKTLDTEVISNYLMLINAIRYGETEIHLDPKFKSGSGGNYLIHLIALSDQPVRIIGNPDSKQYPVLDCGLVALNGSWIVEGVDIKQTGKEDGYCVSAYQGARITLTGNCSGTSCGIAWASGGTIEITGNAQTGTEQTAAVGADSGSIRFTGDLSVTKNCNAVYVINEGKIEITGNISGKVNKQYPLICVNDGMLNVSGNVSLPGDCLAVYMLGGDVEINGAVNGRANKNAVIGALGGKLRITGDVSIAGNGNAVYVKGGDVEIKGAVSGKINREYPVICMENGTLRVIGDVSVASDGSAFYGKGGTVEIVGAVFGKTNKKKVLLHSENGELTISGSISTSGGLIKNDGGKVLIKGNANAGKDIGHYPIWLTSSGNEVTIEGNLTVDNFAALVNHGTLTIGKNIIYTGRKQKEAEKTSGGTIRVLHNK